MIDQQPEPLDLIPNHISFQRFNSTGILNVVGIDHDGRIVYANQAELAYTEYSAEEYIGKLVSDFYENELYPDVTFSGGSHNKELYNVEFILNAKSGALKYALISSKDITDAQGLTYKYLFIRDITQYKKNENLLSYLNTAAEVLAGARDTSDAFEKISKLIVPKFANWFTIDVLKDGELELLTLAHEDPEYIKSALEYRKNYPTDLNADHGTALVLRTGEPSFVPVITAEMLDAGIPDREQLEIISRLGLKSVITVAMFNKDVVTGVVTFISTIEGKAYDEADLRFAQNFANHIGLALENARLNEEIIAKLERRKKMEAELRKTQMQLKSALSSGLIGTWIRDLDKQLIYVDESLSNIFGLEYSIEGLDPAIFLNRIHPDDRAASSEKRKHALETGEDYEAEYRVLNDDGEVKWVFARGKVEFDAEGNATTFSGVVGDITQRKMAEHALKESEERFRLMAETMPQKIFITDADAGLVYLSPQWEEFTGYSMEEINKVTLAHFIHPEDLEENLRRWNEAIKTESKFEYEHRFRAKDGKYYWHLTRALALKNQTGKKLWIGSITDIDDQKNNEHKKDEFISIASHELKTPITSLRGYLQILGKIAEKDGHASISDLVSRTHRQAHKLSTLINDLLDVSKMQAGKMNYNFIEFNFSEIVEDAITDAHNNYQSHKITVKGISTISVFGDKNRLEQVLSNLLSNAAKYSPDAQEIILSIAPSDDYLTVSIQDFGVGIPEDKARFIFNRFFRVEDTSYKFAGLGIGLFISQEIIQRHKGKIGFSSTEGEGSTFTFILPLKQ
ncbi:MAG TPA: PAS domain S-box protein [Pedobacter sp.]|jgi:PAS domain S-box-containing protein